MPHMGGLRIVFRMFFAGAYMALGHWCAGVSMQRLSGRMAILPLGVLVGVSVGFLPHEMTGATLPTMLPCMAAAMAGILMCWGLCR